MDLSNNNNNLSVIQWNSGGLSHSKLQEFKDFLHDKNPHIVLLSETHWKENKNKEKEKQYKSMRQSLRLLEEIDLENSNTI